MIVQPIFLLHLSTELSIYCPFQANFENYVVQMLFHSKRTSPEKKVRQ